MVYSVVDSFIKDVSLLVMEITFREEVLFVIYLIVIAVLAFPQCDINPFKSASFYP
jgi:hypothetical protein